MITKVPDRVRVIACALAAAVLAADAQPADRELTASSKRAAIAAATPEAVEAALAALRAGGNAVDAAAAAAFALMVTDPAMCSLGGRSQILIRLADGTVSAVDGATRVPGTVGPPALKGEGYQTCAVPGSPAALEEMVRSHGRLPLRVSVQPAIRLARDGFVVSGELHDQLCRHRESLERYPGSARHFLKTDGRCPGEGERLLQPVLARTLEAIADGGAGVLYRGRFARAIARDMATNGGYISEHDLTRYRPLPGVVLKDGYRDLEVLARGDQCDGASVIEALHMLEQYPVAGLERFGFEALHLIAQSIYIATADEHLPDWMQLSRELGLRRGREIDLSRRLPVSVRTSRSPEDGETNHLSVADAEGNAVAITQSIGPILGTKVANPELGFFYAYSYTMNENPVPYQRDKTSQAPTILLREGKPCLVLGSAGSVRIPGSVIQTILNVVDFGMALDQAIAAPRIFLYNNELRIETAGVAADVVSAFERLGYKVRGYDRQDGWFGRVHGVTVDQHDLTLHAAADPRDLGAAGGL
jgi:gamma-glutamyltranspeptidase/glutathione hydrolase